MIGEVGNPSPAGVRVRRARNLILVTWLLASGGAPGRSADVVPVNVRTAPGQFDIAAQDASLAYGVSAIADETWRILTTLLDLPPAFSSPVFVRVIGAAADDEPFGAAAEPGGIVSVWIEAAAVRRPELVRRALTRGLLLRLGIAARGAEAMQAVPRWLEDGCVLWVDTRVSPARLDAIKYETIGQSPPALGSLLNEAPTGTTAPGRAAAALWLLTFLQGEATGQREWSSFLQKVLRGMPGDEALLAAYPGRFMNARERELWWQTGWHHVHRVRVLPTMTSEESAREVDLLARFIFAPALEDVVVPLRTVLAHAHDGIVAGEIERRAVELRRIAPALHPFYRNAGLSLLDAFSQARAALPERRDVLATAFEADWRDAVELAAATKSILDAHEQPHP